MVAALGRRPRGVTNGLLYFKVKLELVTNPLHQRAVINLIETVSIQTTQYLQFPQNRVYREFPDGGPYHRLRKKSIPVVCCHECTVHSKEVYGCCPL